MNSTPNDVNRLIRELLALEQQLTAVLTCSPNSSTGSLAETDALTEVKAILDRVRPLLWIHLHHAPVRRDPASVDPEPLASRKSA